MKTKFLLSLLTLVIFLQACRLDKGKDIPDVSHIELDLEIQRFDQALFQIDSNRMEEEIGLLYQAFPGFAPIFFDQVLGATDPRIAPEGPENYIKGFISYPGIEALYDTCQIVFAGLEDIEAEFESAFQYLAYYFPELPEPTVTTFVSEYTVANFIYANNDLAVGLDFFLGASYPYQQYNPGNPNFSQYLTRTYNKDHLVARSMLPLVEEIAGNPGNNRLLDFMILNGKKRYLLEKLLPHAPDTVLLEFSKAQLDWCKDNELETWGHLLSEELLYSTRYQDFRKLIEYSPTAIPSMPPEAPGRVGNYIGLQIVKAYMKRHPETTLQELIALEDAQAILDRSKYRPPR